PRIARLARRPCQRARRPHAKHSPRLPRLLQGAPASGDVSAEPARPGAAQGRRAVLDHGRHTRRSRPGAPADPAEPSPGLHPAGSVPVAMARSIVLELEELAFRAWPAEEVVDLDGW